LYTSTAHSAAWDCSDTYAKLTLMSPNGQEITHSKTSVRRGQPNPLYKETFMFQVAATQLPEVTLMVSVFYNRNIRRKDMIGWFSLGNLRTKFQREVGGWRGTVVERRSLTGELSLSCARPAADG